MNNMSTRTIANREWMEWRAKNTPSIILQVMQAGVAIMCAAFPSLADFFMRLKPNHKK